jgi:hypothetical protein
MEAGAKREAMASSLGTEADQEHNGSGYTIAATNCMNLYQHENLHYG